MKIRLTVLLSLLAFLVPLGAKESPVNSISARLKKSHHAFLETRRELLLDLADPFEVASRAVVIEEAPEARGTKNNEEQRRSSWRRGITATVFWVGELPTPRNPTPNFASSWDPKWQLNYGGVDRPELRKGFLPKGFIPKQSPFYIALPYNDLKPGGGHKPEASEAIPWFWKVHKSSTQSVCHRRWVAIHREGKICYAQWRDCGPYTTDDWRYVFLGERPKPNPNGNAGIDLSPAVRDYLSMGGNYKVDWKFVEDFEVPDGPWKNWLPQS